MDICEDGKKLEALTATADNQREEKGTEGTSDKAAPTSKLALTIPVQTSFPGSSKHLKRKSVSRKRKMSKLSLRRKMMIRSSLISLTSQRTNL